MKQLELFPFDTVVRKVQTNAFSVMLGKINDAYSEYVTHIPSRMYADHVIFTDGDTPTFTIVPEFWPDLSSRYMDEAHPTMYDRISEGIDDSFAV